MKKNPEEHINLGKAAKPGNNVMRTVNVEKSKNIDGEYEIILKISGQVTDLGGAETVSAKGNLQRQGNSKMMKAMVPQTFNYLMNV